MARESQSLLSILNLETKIERLKATKFRNISKQNVADKTNLDKNINVTIWATWSKFHKTDNPEDAARGS